MPGIEMQTKTAESASDESTDPRIGHICFLRPPSDKGGGTGSNPVGRVNEKDAAGRRHIVWRQRLKQGIFGG